MKLNVAVYFVLNLDRNVLLIRITGQGKWWLESPTGIVLRKDMTPQGYIPAQRLNFFLPQILRQV